MVQTASQLANLMPPWPRDNVPRKRAVHVERAIAGLRRAAPDAVKLCHRMVLDPDENPILRLRAAVAIIDKAIPGNQAFLQAGDDLVTRVTIEIQRHGAPLGESDSVTIEAAPDREQLTFTTVPAGHGND